MGAAHGCVPAKGICERCQSVTVASALNEWRAVSDDVAGVPQIRGESVYPLRENGPAIVKEDEQVGDAVVIDIDGGSNVFVSGRVEFLNQIDLIIEIPIRFTPDERTVLVILLHV